MTSQTTAEDYDADYDDEYASDDGDEAKEEADEYYKGLFFVDAKGLVHPKKPTAFETNRMVLITTKRPSDEELAVCATDVAAIGRASLNGDSLVKSKDVLGVAVSKNPTFYHWCFYRYMNSVDQQLSGAWKNFQFEKRYNEFLGSMKTLWILARALDRQQKVRGRYFKYLRKRYVEISKVHFARKLQVIAPPLGDKRPPIRFVQPGKPASEFQENQ